MFGECSLSAVKVEIGSIGIKNKEMAFKDMYCNSNLHTQTDKVQ